MMPSRLLDRRIGATIAGKKVPGALVARQQDPSDGAGNTKRERERREERDRDKDHRKEEAERSW